MFPCLRFELIDVKRNRSIPIKSTVLQKYQLSVCDTIETVKVILSQSLQIPAEYISMWDKTSGQFIGMRLISCNNYTLYDVCNQIVDPLFNDAKKTSVNCLGKICDEQDDEQEEEGTFGSFGSFGTFGDTSSSNFSTAESNFLQENFMFDSTTTISSFLSIPSLVEKDGGQQVIQIFLLRKDCIQSCTQKLFKGWVNKYWGRATKRSKYQKLKRDVQKYFDIKDKIADISERLKDHYIKERISIIDYKSRKTQHRKQHSSQKKLSKYGEDIFESLELTRELPFASMKIPSLDQHLFRMYVGEDTILGVDDVDTFIYQTQRVNGLSLRMVNSESTDSYVYLDYHPERSEITCVDEKILLDSTVNMETRYRCLDICNGVTKRTISQSEKIYESFSDKCGIINFDDVGPSELTKLTLKWKMYVPVSRVQDVIDKKLMGPLFKKVTLNSSHKKNKYISQNFLKFEFDPCIWSKMGNNLSTKLSCTIRTTSSNSVIVTVQSSVLKRKVVEGKTKDSIDLFLTLWVYDTLRTIILSKLLFKKKSPQLSSSLRLKDIDPYLFGESVRNGGYTRKCLNWGDDRLGNLIRYRQPMVINIDCADDMKLYRSLKHPGPIIKYRNNYYVGMRDELENFNKIEAFNKNVSSPKDNIEYFNMIIFFEIHEDYYRAPNAKNGLIYPACVQRKDKLSKRHIDLMRQAYFETDEDRRIEIVEGSVGAKDLVSQLKKHEFSNNCDVGYIMQASRTLPINSFGRLPIDGSGVYEWFRQSSKNFCKGSNEFLRKGTMHLDEYNLVHAIFDCLNLDKYRNYNITKRSKMVKAKCLQFSKHCNFGLFRTLQDGTLAQRIDYESFIKELQNPTTQFLHTEFADLFSYCLSVNIIIFDCDTYSHSKSNHSSRSRSDACSGMEQKKGYIASSAKIYYTTLSYNRFIFLLKMRGTYEIIVWYDGISHVSSFVKSDMIVQRVLKLDKIHSQSQMTESPYPGASDVSLTKQLSNMHAEFTIVGQILNANNQCTHVILAVANVPIPVNGLCIPFKNDDFKYVPILRYTTCKLFETIVVISHVAIKFPKYKPQSVVFERRYIDDKPGEYEDIVYAVKLENGLFCDVEEVLLGEVVLPAGIGSVNNMSLRTPYYPECVNAIILGVKDDDERCCFMKTLNNVILTFNYLRETWHRSIQQSTNHNFKKYIENSYKIDNHKRREFLNTLICKLWDNSVSEPKIPFFYRQVMTERYRELRFVMLNYLYRNPKFFINSFDSVDSKRTNKMICESGANILKFGGIDPLRDYLKECTRRQISHLHVTVKKQRRITYIPPTDPFVQLDVQMSEKMDIPTFRIVGGILDVILNKKLLEKNRKYYQDVIASWLNIFDRTRHIMGSDDITFGDLIYRDDDAAICLALSVVLNRTIEVIDLKRNMKCIYGSTLSYAQFDKIKIFYLDEEQFGKL